MKKSYFVSSLIVLAGAALSAMAGETDPLRISVPFPFRAGAAEFPAGTYTILEEKSGVVTIHGDHSGAFVLGRTGAETDSEKPGVRFDRSGDGYVLKEVHAFGKASTILPSAPSVE